MLAKLKGLQDGEVLPAASDGLSSSEQDTLEYVDTFARACNASFDEFPLKEAIAWQCGNWCSN
jgi:hypothetical protein